MEVVIMILHVLLLPPVSHTMSLLCSTVVAVKDSVDVVCDEEFVI